MSDCYLHAAVRTSFGRFGGALSCVRPDDLSGHVNALLESTPGLEAVQVDEVVWGRASLDAAMIASRTVETGYASVVVDGGVE